MIQFGNILPKRVFNSLIGYPVVRGADAVIALTESERAMQARIGVSPERSHVNRTGFDLDELRQLPPRGAFRARHGIDEESVLVLFVGRLHVKKGLELLLDAYARVQDAAPSRLIVAGPDDGMLSKLQAQASALDISNDVLFPGSLERTELFEVLTDADIFVMPSQQDAEPSAVVEALILGVPVVITDRCQMDDVVGRGAGVVAPYELDGFAGALRKMLSSAEFRRRCSAGALDVATEVYDIQNTIDRLEDIYESVLRQHCGTHGRT